MAEEKKKLKDISNFVVKITEKNENGEYAPLPTLEFLPATLASVTEKPTKNGSRARFEYHLLGEYEGRRAWFSVPLHKTITEDTDLYKVIAMHLGKDTLDLGDFSLRDIVGKQYDVLIENQTNKNDSKKVYQNVTKVRPSEEPVAITEENIEIKKATRKSAIKKRTTAPVVETEEDIVETDVNIEDGNEEDIDLPF